MCSSFRAPATALWLHLNWSLRQSRLGRCGGKEKFQARGTASAKARSTEEQGLFQWTLKPTWVVPASFLCPTLLFPATAWHHLVVLCVLSSEFPRLPRLACPSEWFSLVQHFAGTQAWRTRLSVKPLFTSVGLTNSSSFRAIFSWHFPHRKCLGAAVSLPTCLQGGTLSPCATPCQIFLPLSHLLRCFCYSFGFKWLKSFGVPSNF